MSKTPAKSSSGVPTSPNKPSAGKSSGGSKGRRSRRKRRVEMALQALWGLSILAAVGGVALWFFVIRPKLMAESPGELTLSNVRAARTLDELDRLAVEARKTAEDAHDYDLASEILEAISESRFRMGRTASDQNHARAEKFQALAWKLDSVTLDAESRTKICEDLCKEVESQDSDTPVEIRRAALMTYLDCMDWMLRQVDSSASALDRLIAIVPQLGSDFKEDLAMLEKLRDVVEQVPVNSLEYKSVEPLSKSLLQLFGDNSNPQVTDWVIGFRDRVQFRKTDFVETLENARRGSEVALEDVMSAIEPVLEGNPSRSGLRRVCAVLWTLEGLGRIEEAKTLADRIQTSLRNYPSSLAVGEFTKPIEVAKHRLQTRGRPLQFQLKNMRGRVLTPGDFSGKVLVIVFIGGNHPNRVLNSQNDIFGDLQRQNVVLLVVGQGMGASELVSRYGSAVREELMIPDPLSNCELGELLGIPTDPFSIVLDSEGQLVESAVPLPNLLQVIDKLRE